MNIRPARQDDIPAVLPMVAKICQFHERIDPAKYGFIDHPEERYRHWLGKRVEDERSVFLVADAAGASEPARPVGFLIGTVEQEIPIYHLKEFGFIHDVWVEENYRNEGVARQMATLAIERFRQIGVKQLRLDVLTNNEPAIALFKACGLRPATTEMLMELK